MITLSIAAVPGLGVQLLIDRLAAMYGGRFLGSKIAPGQREQKDGHKSGSDAFQASGHTPFLILGEWPLWEITWRNDIAAPA